MPVILESRAIEGQDVVDSYFVSIQVGLHEFSHAAAGCCTGAKIEAIEIDPDEGGVTRMRGGIPCWTLPAGYLGSSFIGALLIFCGFNVMASKVASVILGVLLLILLFWAKNWLTRGLTVFFACVIVGLWFIEKGAGLKYFVLFVGCCPAQVWGVIWLFISILFLGVGVLAGLIAFKQKDPE
ncbi:296_t:CDS:2 [Funneliformis geosporum]|nr:296_t:CDS:2 [Funneliformis geosporum]